MSRLQLPFALALGVAALLIAGCSTPPGDGASAAAGQWVRDMRQRGGVAPMVGPKLDVVTIQVDRRGQFSGTVRNTSAIPLKGPDDASNVAHISGRLVPGQEFRTGTVSFPNRSLGSVDLSFFFDGTSVLVGFAGRPSLHMAHLHN